MDSQVHGHCETITTQWRPVPLTWLFCHMAKGQVKLEPLLDQRKRELSPSLRAAPTYPAVGFGPRESWERGKGRKRYAGGAPTSRGYLYCV